MIEYVINGTGNEFQDGAQVKNVVEEDVDFLINTFKVLRPKEKTLRGELIEINYEMVYFFGIRTLKEQSKYKGNFVISFSTKDRYYSRIQTSFGGNQVFMNKISDSFNCLHFVENSFGLTTQMPTIFPEKTFYAGMGTNYKISEESYKSMIKQALVAIRLSAT